MGSGVCTAQNIVSLFILPVIPQGAGISNKEKKIQKLSGKFFEKKKKKRQEEFFFCV